MNNLEGITNKMLQQQLKKIFPIKMTQKIKKNLQKKRNKLIEKRMIKIEENKLKFKEVYRFIFGINSLLIYKFIQRFKRIKNWLKQRKMKLKRLKMQKIIKNQIKLKYQKKNLVK